MNIDEDDEKSGRKKMKKAKKKLKRKLFNSQNKWRGIID